jgi:hypothetical protein
MAVMSVTVLRLKPGRYDDFLKFHTQVEELWAKAGAQNQRLIAAGAAGEATGSIVATWEAEDYEKYGQVLHAFFNSGGAADLGREGRGPDSPIADFQVSTYIDIPR